MLALALFLLIQPHELIEAVRAGSLETSYALLAAGADPNSTDGVGETALIYATFDNRAEIAKILLVFKANVNATWGGSTALDFAVSRGSLRTARLLIDSGADVRRVYPSGRTPLHIAVRSHRTQIAALLIDRGADIDASDNFGFTPLLEAIQKRFDDLVVLLLEAGADPLLKNKAGVSPIAAAASMHRADLTRELLAKVDNPPVELLSESVRRNLPDIVDTLLASGMDPSAALHDAGPARPHQTFEDAAGTWRGCESQDCNGHNALARCRHPGECGSGADSAGTRRGRQRAGNRDGRHAALYGRCHGAGRSHHASAGERRKSGNTQQRRWHAAPRRCYQWIQPHRGRNPRAFA